MKTASKRGWLAGTRQALRPPPELSLSQWADKFFWLSPETAAQPGRWRTLAWQREVMDSITDDTVERVTVMKSARVGYTAALSAALAYHMSHDPTSILIVQPTVEDAKNFSKETIAPMLRDVPALARLAVHDVEDGSATLTHRTFPGGILSLVGANSGTGFRRVSRRVVMFDEVDAYPHSSGNEGDPIKLGERRSEHFWNRKLVAGSTPLVSGASRIEELFLEGDQRRFHMPCPHCGHMDFLRFSSRADDDGELERGHVMRWPPENPRAAHFICRACGCVIEETDKRKMLEAGEWRADNPEAVSHRSYHLWTALSLSPNASWGQIAAEFIEAKRRPETLRTFVNVVLGETWKERGEAPDYERLYQRRELYEIGTVPAGVVVLTAGVDVQKDRFVYEVVGWAPDKENWSVDAGELYGDTALEATWKQLDALLGRTYPGADGGESPISMLAIDSGYNTQIVYGWARNYPMSRVIACKGVSGAKMLVATPSPVDVNVRGRRLQRGYKVWPIGVDIGKSELYGWLRLNLGDGDPPPGFCHFPQYGENFFKELTAEALVTEVNRRTRRTKLVWHQLPNRENHALDARIYARAAAAVLGIDRFAPKSRTAPASKAGAPPAAAEAPKKKASVDSFARNDRRESRQRSSWLNPRGKKSYWDR